MAFDLFLDENEAANLAANAGFQVGVSDLDPAGNPVEQGIKLSWADPTSSWVYYECGIECYLDSGIVVHRHLPQSDPNADTLSSCDVTDSDLRTKIDAGVNVKSVDDFADVRQRMAHSVYRFRLFGQAMRVGYQVPIPGLKKVGGVNAVPDDEQEQYAVNWISGNYSGVILWRAEWSLWYTVTVPPTEDQPAPDNLAAQIDGDELPPDQMQAPYSQPDDEAENSAPALQNPVSP